MTEPAETFFPPPSSTLLAELDAYRAQLHPIADQYDHGLPPEQLFTCQGQTVCLRFGYGFASVRWGPRYINTASDLDAGLLTVNNKTYNRVEVHLVSDPGGMEVRFYGSELTPSAKRYVRDLAPTILEIWATFHPDQWAAWLEAGAAEDRSHQAHKIVKAIDHLTATLTGSENE